MRQIGRRLIAAPLARKQPHRERRLNGEGLLGHLLRERHQPGLVEAKGSRIHVRRRPALLGNPAAGATMVARGRRDAVLHPHAKHRLRIDTVLRSFEPPVPPPAHLLQKADCRSGHTLVGILVAPRPDEPLPRHREMLHEAKHRVGVAVRPPAYRHNWTSDGVVVLAHRTMLPVLVTPLPAHPGLEPQPAPRKALHPHLAPPLAHEGRVRRMGVLIEHRRSPGEVVAEKAASHVVHVVGVAVVGGADGDDCPQRLRPKRGDLQAVEPAPGDADHPHRSRAPRLRGKPVDDLHPVVELLLEVFVGENAVGLPASPEVHAHRGIAEPGDIWVMADVALCGEIALSVGDVLENRRDRIGIRIDGQPHARGKPRAVG